MAPVALRNWASLVSNLVLCAACVWLLLYALFRSTGIREFLLGLALVTALQLALAVTLNTLVRKLRCWPDTPKLPFYRFALAAGLLPVGIAAVMILLNWLGLGSGS